MKLTAEQPCPVTLIVSDDVHMRMTQGGQTLARLSFPVGDPGMSGSYRIVFWGLNHDKTWTAVCEPLLN